MKVQLHTHTSRYSICADDWPDAMLRLAVNHGYDAVYLTEHDAVWPEEQLDELRSAFPSLAIYGGVEVSFGMCHLLVLGTSDPRYAEVAPATDILDRARREGHLTVLAHPYRWSTSARILDDGAVPDALEMWTPNHSARAAGLATAQAERLGIRLVNAGDVHRAEVFGTYWIETGRPLDRADDVREAVLDGDYTCHADAAVVAELRVHGIIPRWAGDDDSSEVDPVGP